MVLMRIVWSPQRRDETAVIMKSGDVLTVDGVAFDFSPLPDGATLPADATGSDLIGNVDRIAGKIVITMILPHGPLANEAVRFPQPWADVPDGPVAIPDTWTAPEVTEADEPVAWSAPEVAADAEEVEQ
ncbi:hypothetical protein N185_35355 [Sinorhizobium sp. GW3]|nr:hypothetical protein N185_35355 [Sinorhizobium sp. GW3]